MYKNSMRYIRLPVYSIVISLGPEQGQGDIHSSLNMVDMYGMARASYLSSDSIVSGNAALDAIERIVLAHAIGGVEVWTPAYINGIEVAVNDVLVNVY